jgi:hypothetical protein
MPRLPLKANGMVSHDGSLSPLRLRVVGASRLPERTEGDREAPSRTSRHVARCKVEGSAPAVRLVVLSGGTLCAGPIPRRA